jgi:3-isopropylmalate/(R)-2-methylmalate dehydratase large subunit
MTALPAKTMAEKILSHAIGRDVSSGEIISPEPGLITIHDLYVVNFDRTLKDLGVTRLHDPKKVLVCTDHEPVALSVASAERQKAVREIVAYYGIDMFYDAGRGGHGHIFPVEEGIVKPGQFVAGFDMHVANFGAIGALGIYFGAEISEVLACGSAWIKVPESVRVNLTGRLATGVSVRDVSQHVTSLIGDDLLDYSVVEYGGSGLARIGVPGRMTLCNTPLESSAKSAIVETDEVIDVWAEQRGFGAFERVQPDAGAQYRRVFDVELSELTPQVAPPPHSTGSVDVGEFEGIKIHHAFIGSCANGSLEDLREAARIVAGRRIAKGVRMVITPGTQRVAAAAAEEGLLRIFIEAGISVSAPGCGVCAVGMLSPIAPGEVSINTGTVNHPGRLGSNEAQIYLASPATVAASAVVGAITDPRTVLLTNQGGWS